jgi:polyhydroxybutyrate depolymerase
MRRKLLLALAFVLTFGIATFAGTNVINALERTTYTATYSIKAGGLNRSYEVIAPVATLPDNAPIIVVLSGISAPVQNEIKRDLLTPYVNSGQAELVYPVAYQESWDAGDCCGMAATHHVNDLAFMQALVPAVDPGHQHPIYVVGYSNGGRLAYEVACASPGLFDAYAIVKAMPDPGCDLSKPVTILQIDSLDDYAVPYKPGEKGLESPPATVQNVRLRDLDGCTGAGAAARHGEMTMTTWTDCASGQRVGFAVWDTGGHNFPNYGQKVSAATPNASQIIWSFFTKTPVAPLPS